MTTGACTHRSIFDVLPLIRQAGVTGVEIGTPPRHFNPADVRQVSAVHEVLRSLSLTAISLHAPFGTQYELADPDAARRRSAMAAVLTAAAALKDFGGRLVIVHPSDLERHHHDAQARLADSAASLDELAQSCAQMGLVLVIESPLPHLIGGHPDEFAWILRQMKTHVRVCLDTGHTFLGHHWQGFLNIADGRLAHVHVNDNHGHRDDHLPPGDGRIDWKEISSSLAAVNFKGWAMLELHCHDADPAGFFRRAVDQARQFIAP